MITIVFTLFNLIVMYCYIIKAEKERRQRGRVFITNGERINYRLFMGLIYTVIGIFLLIEVSTWEELSIRVAFLICGLVWIYRGILKTELCENGIYTPEYIIKWGQVTDYNWIDLSWKGNDSIEFTAVIFNREKKVCIEVDKSYKENLEEFLKSIAK